MSGLEENPELIAAKLRNLKHYCLDTTELDQVFGSILAREVECGRTSTPQTIKTNLEDALTSFGRETHSEESWKDYGPVYQLYVLEVILPRILDINFLRELQRLYDHPKATKNGQKYVH